MASYLQDPVTPFLVARLVSHEREQQSLERDFESYVSQNNAAIREHLFDTGADRSFVSTEFRTLIDISPTTLEAKYSIELVNGKLIETDSIIRCCTLNIVGHPFAIDLMPIELGSFDIVIGMDWLSENHAEIICDKKIVRIPLSKGKVLSIKGEGSQTKLSIISNLKTLKYLQKGCDAFLAYMT